MSARPSPIAVGVGYALAAAVSFGLTTPLVQRAGVGMGSFTTAALLYGGAALLAAVPTTRAGAEAPLTRAHLRPLLGMAFAGAFLAPVLLAAGLQRSSGTAASLLLNLEAVFTVALGALVHGEGVGRRVGVAVAVIAAGGAVVGLAGGPTGEAGGLGLALVAAATLCWAVDNTVSRAVADVDPRLVVVAKGALGASLSLVLARTTGEALPGLAPAAAVAACGALGYGASLRLYLRAQRVLGSARTGSVFAVAPFVGACLAAALGEATGGWPTLLGGVCMAAGVWLHLTESHDHAHEHPALTHAHAHRHDDGHHDDHTHPDLPAGVEHAHVHTHQPRAHRHAHGEDIHHQHHG